MRYLFAAIVLAGAVFGTAAQAEKRTFIVANNSDGDIAGKSLKGPLTRLIPAARTGHNGLRRPLTRT